MSIYELKKIEEFENLPLNVLYKIMELTEDIEQRCSDEAWDEAKSDISDIEDDLDNIENVIYEIRRKIR